MLQTIAFMVYLLGGAAVYARIEEWTFVDAVYWADFTLLTIGIGVRSPIHFEKPGANTPRTIIP